MLTFGVFGLAELAVGIIIGALMWRFFSERRTKYFLKENSELKDRLASAERLIAQRVKAVENNQAVITLHDPAAVKPETLAEPEIRGRVQVTRTKGNSRRVFPDSFVGHEEHPPEAGKPYSVFTEQGWHFRSSTVEQVGDGLIKTLNSEYRIELLEKK
jgi:hypothetical protein